MDLRRPVLCVLVGGTPAPGINGVIAAVAIEALNSGWVVKGLIEGFKHAKCGRTGKYVRDIWISDVSQIHTQGGSMLKMSKQQLKTDLEIDNVLRALQHLRCDYLVTIGGTNTAYSTSLVARAAADQQYVMQCVHVPKTIFNDLPLPSDSRTFGFSTAREVGMKIVSNLIKDATAMSRWYVVTVMGTKAGHLALGIGKTAAVTLSLIPEEFRSVPGGVRFKTIVDICDATMIKRTATGRNYGSIVLTEGLVDVMNRDDIETLFGGDIDNGHIELGRQVCDHLRKRWAARSHPFTVVARELGYELRSANPNAEDVELSRELGYGAVKFLRKGGSEAMVSIKGGNLHTISFKELIDPISGQVRVRNVDLKTQSYEVACKYMIRFVRRDMSDSALVHAMAAVAKMSVSEFRQTYSAVAQQSCKNTPMFSPSQPNNEPSSAAQVESLSLASPPLHQGHK